MKISKEEYRTNRDAIRDRRGLGWEERTEKLNKLWLDYCDGMEVGDRANVLLWTDVNPCTVIKRTAKTITVRYDKATLDPNWKPDFVVGGFCAHCTNNNEQEWVLEDNPDGQVEVFRRRKNGWFNRSDCKLTPGWRKFHDYNF